MESAEVEKGKSYRWKRSSGDVVVTIEGKGFCGLSARTADGRLVFPRSKHLEPLPPREDQQPAAPDAAPSAL